MADNGCRNVLQGSMKPNIIEARRFKQRNGKPAADTLEGNVAAWSDHMRHDNHANS